VCEGSVRRLGLGEGCKEAEIGGSDGEERGFPG